MFAPLSQLVQPSVWPDVSSGRTLSGEGLLVVASAFIAAGVVPAVACVREARALRAPAGVPGRIWARDLDGALDVLAGWRLSRAPGPRDATREIRLLRKRPDALLAPLDRARRPAAGGGGALGRSAPEAGAGRPGPPSEPRKPGAGGVGAGRGLGRPRPLRGPAGPGGEAANICSMAHEAWCMEHGGWCREHVGWWACIFF